MGTYQRPLRPDELMHWGKGETSKNHKYIAKIGNRYFYTPQDLQAFKQGVSGKVSSAKETVYNKIGGAEKRKAKASAQRANVLKNTSAKTREQYLYDREGLAQAKELKRAQDATMSRKSEAGHVARIENIHAKRAAEEYGHSDNSHSTGHVDVVYKKSKVPASTTERGRIQANTNRLIKEYEKDEEKSRNQDFATHVAAENAQKVADKDAAAYRKTLLGRVEDAKKKVNHTKNAVERGKKKVDEIRRRSNDELNRAISEVKNLEGTGTITLSDGTTIKVEKKKHK